MNEIAERVRFLTVVGSEREARPARLMIESLRAFGGALGDCSIWVFSPGIVEAHGLARLEGVTILPLEMEEPFRSYDLADKVFACARAEELSAPGIHSLVWMNLDCLVVNPPLLLDLDGSCDAALRPVHITNVGSPVSNQADEYWQAVYRQVGAGTVPFTVQSFVDARELRPYFNTHCFSMNPAMGILQAWGEHFRSLVLDREFQSTSCRDDLHRLFLHQVVLSALVMKSVKRSRLRMLPASYNYPVNFQSELPTSRRIQKLNDTVCAVYEETSLLDAIEVQEPLHSWLIEHNV